MDGMSNLAVSTLVTAPSPATSGTSLVVTAGHGTRFPTPPFNATVWPTATTANLGNAEIVRVTARSSDTLTISRAQESTTARSMVAGDQIALTVTKKAFDDVTADITSVRAKLGTLYLNALDSGCAADGVTNDGTTLGDWLYAVPANSIVRFPPNRTILITTGLTLNNIGVQIVGAGCVLKLSSAAATGTTMIQFLGDSQAVDGLTFDTQSKTDATCVRPRANFGTVERCRFLNPMTGGVYIQGAIKGTKVLGNTATGTGWGVLFDEASSASDTAILGNTFDGTGGTGGDGVQVNTPTFASPGATNVTITGNTVRGYTTIASNQGMGIGLANAHGGSVTGNTITGCGLDGIHLEDACSDLAVSGNTVLNCARSGISSQPGAGPDAPYDMAVMGNTISGCGTGDGSGGIALEGAAGSYDIQLIGNKIRGCGRAGAATYYGIDAGDGSYNITMMGNEVLDTAGTLTAGIRAANPTGATIIGNRCANELTTSQDYGLLVTGTVTSCVVKNNNLAGNATGPGYVSAAKGTATVASGTTSVAVTHGLTLTPAAQDIQLTRTNSGGSSTKYWISATSSTTFTITVDVNPGATTATFAWAVDI